MYSGALKSRSIPIDTGHVTPAAVRPRPRTAPGSVCTWMARAYQYHAPFERFSGSRMRLS